MFTTVVEELVGLTDDALVERIEANELERRRLDAEQAALLAVADQRNVHGIDGHRSMVAFCRARLNYSTAEAGRRLGLARAVDAVPGLGEAWHVGRFGSAQALQFSKAHGNCRVRDDLPAFAPLLLDNAEQMPYADFKISIDHFVEQADQDGAHDDRDEAVEGRRARVVDVAGTLDLNATGGDPLTVAELIAIHDRFTQAEYADDLEVRRAEHGADADAFALPRTDRQRRFDALVAIFRTANGAHDADASSSEPLVNIVIDAETWGRLLVETGLSTSSDLAGNRIDPFTGLPIDESEQLLDQLRPDRLRNTVCETSTGVQLHPHDVLRAAVAGHVRRVVVDSKQVTIDLGRRQRLFTGSARHAAQAMIRRCEHAGCALPVDWCETDHDDEWVLDGGRTDQINARIHCGRHNRDKHRHRWRTRRDTRGISRTIRADGTIILPVGVRPPTFDDEIDDHDHDDGLAGRQQPRTEQWMDELVQFIEHASSAEAVRRAPTTARHAHDDPGEPGPPSR